ncbi:MAG: hypothetical protein ACYDEC_07460 [Bacteroidia bacterium]
MYKVLQSICYLIIVFGLSIALLNASKYSSSVIGIPTSNKHHVPVNPDGSCM